MIRFFSIVLLIFLGCTPKESMTYFNGIAMTVPYKITIAKKLSKKEQKQVSHLIYEVFTQIDEVFNPWNPNSEISKFNQSSSTDWIGIPESLSEFLLVCEEYVQLTDGLFDPTVGSIIGKWKASFQKHLTPVDLQECVGFHYIKIKNKAIRKTDPTCQIDLCGVCKGYAVDLLVERLSQIGYKDLCVDWGGEIKCLGSHISKRAWNLQIALVEVPSKDWKYISLENSSVASSGTFMPYQWIAKEESYYHIFHPKTKSPMKNMKYGVSSVSVQAPSCAMADALATACMTLPTMDQAKIWAENIVKSQPEVIFYIFNPKQKIFMKIERQGTLFFDIGNVLLKFNHEKMIQQIGNLCSLSKEEIHHFLLKKDYFLQYELGNISSEELFKKIRSISKRTLNYDDLLIAACDIFEDNFKVRSLIASLKELGHTLILLSNTNEAHFSFMTKNYPVLAQFDDKILSYEVGLRKPDPKIFIKSLELSKTSLNFYIDDIEENVISARKIGLDATLFTSGEELEKTLKQKKFLI